VEDSSARWAVTIEITSFKESISFFEQEMIFDELLLIFFTSQIGSNILNNPGTTIKIIAAKVGAKYVTF
jgi:hypothetical protein